MRIRVTVRRSSAHGPWRRIVGSRFADNLPAEQFAKLLKQSSLLSYCDPGHLMQTGGHIVDRGDKSLNRLERRKRRTRAALINAAQGFIADGRLNVPVQDICQAADVGVGSFYNHFDTKEELFQAAVNDYIDTRAALLDSVTESIEDPAEKFAARYRVTARMFRLRPTETRIGIVLGTQLMMTDRGLGPRGIRDIRAATEVGRFTVTDPELAMVIAAGALLGLGQLLNDRPERDDAQTADEVTESLLKLFGMSDEEAYRICQLPLQGLAAIRDADDQFSETA
jgi:AcrR family transcriptional regulator